MILNTFLKVGGQEAEPHQFPWQISLKWALKYIWSNDTNIFEAMVYLKWGYKYIWSEDTNIFEAIIQISLKRANIFEVSIQIYQICVIILNERIFRLTDQKLLKVPGHLATPLPQMRSHNSWQVPSSLSKAKVQVQVDIVINLSTGLCRHVIITNTIITINTSQPAHCLRRPLHPGHHQGLVSSELGVPPSTKSAFFSCPLTAL